MTRTLSCERCGARIPEDAPIGDCPTCLLRAGLSSSSVGEEPFDRAELSALFPRMEILELLGKGGMGVVYRARQTLLDREVALKILPREVAVRPGFAERFEREARTLAKLDHPQVVGVYEAGRAGDLYFLVMEYVDGVNLRQAMGEGGLSPREALSIVPQICDALQYAHDQGVVHRDVKPENILIDSTGRVKIADFGLAKLLDRDRHDLTLTGTDQVMGTLHYMAPEQMRRPLEVDHRADIFSLGVVFYEMLTGELPMGRFPPPSERVQVDVRLDEVVLRALETEREQRYQRADDVKTGVTSLSVEADADSVPVVPPEAPTDTQAPPPIDSKELLGRMMVWGLVGGIATLVYIIMDSLEWRLSIVGMGVILVGAAAFSLVRIGGRIPGEDPARRKERNRVRALVLVPLLLLLAVGGTAIFYNARKDPPRRASTAELEHLRTEAKRLLRALGGGMSSLNGIVDPAEVDKVYALPEGERLRGYEAEEFGIAFVKHETLPAGLWDFEIAECRIERFSVDGTAHATVLARYQDFTIRFPMIQRENKWFLAVGQVVRGG